MITKLWVKELRNINEGYLTISPNRHCYIYGKNNQGKSSILESLYLAIRAESPFQEDRKKIIQYEKEKANIGIDIDSDEQLRVYCSIDSSGKRELIINNKKSRSFKVLEKVMAIEYISADVLHFFQKDAAFRRKHLDYYCSFCYLDYTELLKDYDSILKQKNRYLKQENCNQAMLDIYNKQLVEKGVPLVKIRLEACLELEKCLIKSLRDLSILQFDVLELSYIKKRLETVSLQEYSDKWTAQLALDRDKENFLGYTLSGPHRDDIQLNLDHHDITNFSSRGINRILALLFKLSSMDSIKEKLSVKSCLLLDDTLAEIDDDNKEKLLSYMLRYDQVFYATTESNDFSYFNDACLYHVHNGELSLCLS